VIERAGAIEQKRAESGCFVLITNRPLEGDDAQNTEDILRTYKAQDGIERNFSFLKDPLIVNNIFLKKPQRIEALGLVWGRRRIPVCNGIVGQPGRVFPVGIHDVDFRLISSSGRGIINNSVSLKSG
jgi:hypothetical protein